MRDEGQGRDRQRRRRRSKNFVKLSGKRTVTGLYSGEHKSARILSPMGSRTANLSGKKTETKEESFCLCLFFDFMAKGFQQVGKKEGE